MNNGGQPQGRPGAIPVPPLHHGDYGGQPPATVVPQPAMTQPRNPQMSQRQVQQAYQAAPQVRAPHPSANIVPYQLSRVAEQSDLRGENLTEEEYRQFLTEYIIYRFEKVETHGTSNSSGDDIQGSWANCTRRRLPTVDKQEAKKEIGNLNKEDRRKGRSLLEKQRSLTSIQQDQLARLEGDLSNDIQLDSRFQIVLAQIHYTLRPIIEKHESVSRRHNSTKRKVREKKKKRCECTSITAYFKRCPRPEQVPSLLYHQLELEKHQEQKLQEQQVRQREMDERMRDRQENERAEQARRVVQQQAQQQQQQAQLLKQQNQLQSQQAQLQHQQALQQQQQQQQTQQQQQQKTQHQGRALGAPQQQIYPIRPGQGKAGQVQLPNNRSPQTSRLAAQHHTSSVQANIGRQVGHSAHGAHGAGRAEHDDTIRATHETGHGNRNHGQRHGPSITASDSDSLYSDEGSSSGWGSETGSEKDSDSTPTSIPSRSSGSYRPGQKSHNIRRYARKQPSHHGRRPQYRDNRSGRHSLHDEREPSAYILTGSDRRLPVLAPQVPQRDAVPIIPAKNVESIRAQAYNDGRSDQKYEDRARLATVAVEDLDVRRYQLAPSSFVSSSALRYEPRTAPRPVIVTEREVPRVRHISHSEVERQLDRQQWDDAYGRVRLTDRERDRDVHGIEGDYEILLPNRAPLQRRGSFVRVNRDIRSNPRWSSSEEDEEEEDWYGVGRGRTLARERPRHSRSPPPLMTTASYRNPFSPEPLRQGRFGHVYPSERGRQRLF